MPYRTPVQTKSLVVDASVGGGKEKSYIDARDYGVLPDVGTIAEVRNRLEVALNAAAAAGKPLLLQPGNYAYSGRINVTGAGGIVCLTGKAKLIASHPTYAENLIYFSGPSAANPAVGFRMRNIVFDNATMPNSGLTNGASEYAGFINLTFIRDILVQHCEVIKNFGGFLLLRTCFDAMITDNVCRDMFKDVFHTTGASRNIWRLRNRVYNCGDDAFATVGYLSHGDRPEFIYDFDNFVYGCRRGRAFAYVGAAHVRGRNFADGRTVNPYQAVTPNGHYARGSCALYIASESSFGTYGCEDVDVHIDARYCGPTVVTPGGGSVSNALEPTNSLSVVRIAEAGTTDSLKLKDIRVRGTIEQSPRINVHVTGCENLDLDMNVVDNTDAEGWVGTAGAYAAQAAEFQGLRGKSQVNLDVKTCNHIPVVFGGTSRGNLDARIKINDVLKTQIHDAVFFASGSNFDRLGVNVDLDWDIPAGRLDRFVDIQCTFGELNVSYEGKGSAANVNSLITGGSSSSTPLTGSPQLVSNTSDDDWTVQVRGGAVTSIEQARILVHNARPVSSVSGNVLTIAGDMSTHFLTTRHCVFLGGHGSPAEAGTLAIPISAVSFSGGNTSVTLASAPPLSGSYTRVAPLHTEGFAVIDGITTRFLKLPKNRAFRLTYTTAPSVNVLANKQ